MDTENRILLAAEREFLDKGFAGARTTSIAAAAGVTHAMFHYYFRTKEKLFDRIITEKISILKGLFISSIHEGDLTLSQIIRNIIESHLDFISVNPELPRFIVGEVYSNSDRSKLIIKNIKHQAPAILAFLQNKIDESAEKGLCRKVDAKSLMLDIVSLNIFPYLAAPLVNAALGNCLDDSTKFLENRKKENYETIMRKIRN